MSLDNKISNIIGAKLPQWVLNQLDTRSFQNTRDYRDNNNILYLANKTAWVRLVSSINITNLEDQNYFRTTLGVNIQDETTLAKEFVLFGGTSKYLNKNSYQIRSGLGKDGAYGILGDDEIKKYGYKPMPGINSVNIETQGRLGSVRAATVNFKCWDKSQLDIIDALYFKLGYTMFLEWGHTYFYPSFENGKLDPNKLQSTELYSIDPFEPGLSKEKVFLQIAQNSRSTEGNYDAMLGMVTNFNFTYTQDGGYDCTLRIMSLGILGDSIKINNAPTLPNLLQEQITRYNNTLAKIQKAIADAEAAKTAAATTQELTSQQKVLNDLEKQAKPNDLLQPVSIGYLKPYYTDLTKNEDGRAVLNTIAFDSSNPVSNEAKSDFRKWLKQFVYVNRDYVIVPSNFDRAIYKVDGGNNLNLYQLDDNKFYELDYYIDKNQTYILGKKSTRGNIVISNKNNYTNIVLDIPYLKNRYLKNVKDKNTLQNNLQSFINFTNNENIPELNNGAHASTIDLLLSNETKRIGVSSTEYFKFAITYTSPAVSKDLTKDAYFFNISVSTALKDINGKEWQRADKKLIYTTINNIINSGIISDGAFINTNTAKSFGDKSFRKLDKGNTDPYLNSSVLDKNLNQTSFGPNYWYFSVQYKYKTSLSQAIDITKTTELGRSLQDVVTTERKSLELYLDVVISFNDSSLISDIKSSSDTDALRFDNPTDINKAANTTQQNTGQSTDPVQTKQAITSQSAIELILRAIEVRALDNAISKSGLDIGKKVDTLELYRKENRAFLKSLFSTGIMSSIIEYLADDNILVTNSEYTTATSDIDRFKFNAKYGFATSLLGNKADIQDLKPNDYKETLVAYTVPYEINQEIQKGTNIIHPVYIPFSLLLMVLNHSCTIYDTKATFQTPLIYIDYNNNTNFFLSNAQQLSTNPFVTIIPYEGTSNDFKSLFDPAILDGNNIKHLSGSTEAMPIFNTQQDALSKSILKVKSGDSTSSVYRGKMMNVLLNVEYIIKLVQDYSYKDGSNNVYLKPFLEQILSDINKYLGDFNTFRLSYNDQANAFQIVDDQFVPSPYDNEPQVQPNQKQFNVTNRTEIPLFGKSSIAKSLEIKTDISSRLANMIAISSNSTIENKTTLSTNGDSVGYINTNFIDRYITDKLEISGSTKFTKDYDTLKISARHFNQTIKDFYSTINPSEANVSDATNYYIEKMSRVKNDSLPTRASTLIPVSINFTTDGISGLGMGQAFTVNPELLPYTYTTKKVAGMPKDYDNNVGFVMVGLNHTIDANSWNTTVRANMIFLKNKTIFNATASVPNSPVNQFGFNPNNPRGSNLHGDINNFSNNGGIGSRVPRNTDQTISLKPSQTSNYIFGSSKSLGQSVSANAHGARDQSQVGQWESSNAWDLIVPAFTPVYAIYDGTVTNVNYYEQGTFIWGWRFTLSGPNNAFYTHLDRVVPVNGAQVKKGDLLGFVGQPPSEFTWPPHLHIALQSGKLTTYISNDGKIL